ncbi:MAG: TetR/AcrR family transcriptional regulator [Nesterenkonia sp.]|nr:TetR/AcrR family transcriptional regulator [Nesterenkonia sp.]
MPKIVDHAARREELVRTTWRIIARHGLDRATMRQIATEAGFANGALKPYFPTKTDLIEATYTYVFERTNERARRSTAGLSGLEAVEAFVREVLPLDDTRLDEARVVIPFWQEAAHRPEKAAANNAAMGQWRRWLISWLSEAREDSPLLGSLDLEIVSDALLTWMLGAQITAVMEPERYSPEELEAQLQVQLRLLTAATS